MQRSYESAYTLLSDMLAPKSSITPGQTGFPLRGKRWEEARELLDCINIKVIVTLGKFTSFVRLTCLLDLSFLSVHE